jgi:hypothetical protein
VLRLPEVAALAGRTMQEKMVTITRNIAKAFFAIFERTSLLFWLAQSGWSFVAD